MSSSCVDVQYGCFYICPGVVQGMITGIRGLCNGLGPALYGFIFFLFNVELNEIDPVQSEKTTPLHNSTDKVLQGENSALQMLINVCTPHWEKKMCDRKWNYCQKNCALI